MSGLLNQDRIDLKIAQKPVGDATEEIDISPTGSKNIIINKQSSSNQFSGNSRYSENLSEEEKGPIIANVSAFAKKQENEIRRDFGVL